MHCHAFHWPNILVLKPYPPPHPTNNPHSPDMINSINYSHGCKLCKRSSSLTPSIWLPWGATVAYLALSSLQGRRIALGLRSSGPPWMAAAHVMKNPRREEPTLSASPESRSTRYIDTPSCQDLIWWASETSLFCNDPEQPISGIRRQEHGNPLLRRRKRWIGVRGTRWRAEADLAGHA
jgi:hypothetical protein